MIRRTLLAVLSTALLAGCTDTIDSVSREYRNANNELIDGLMRVTDETTAKRMKQRVFEPMNFRFKEIELHLKNIKNNRTTKELAKEILESDGFQLYLSDLDMNRQRVSLEMARLRNLVAKIEQKHRQDNNIGDDEDVNLSQVCPTLHNLAFVSSDTFREPFKSPQMLELLAALVQTKGFDYGPLFKSFEEKRKTVYAPKDMPRLLE